MPRRVPYRLSRAVYTAEQRTLMASLRRSGRPLHDLAGHWISRERIEGFAKFRVGNLPAAAVRLVTTAHALSQGAWPTPDPILLPPILLRAYAKALCGAFLWEALFPRDFPRKPITTLALQLGVLDLDATTYPAWATAHLQDSSALRDYLSKIDERPCVRIAQGQISFDHAFALTGSSFA
jgi:hypothetical protein